MTDLASALAWADHKKAAVIPAHVLAAAVRSLQERLKDSEREAANLLRVNAAVAQENMDLRAKLSTAKAEGRLEMAMEALSKWQRMAGLHRANVFYDWLESRAKGE